MNGPSQWVRNPSFRPPYKSVTISRLNRFLRDTSPHVCCPLPIRVNAERRSIGFIGKSQRSMNEAWKFRGLRPRHYLFVDKLSHPREARTGYADADM